MGKKDTKISSNLHNLYVTIVQLSYKALFYGFYKLII